MSETEDQGRALPSDRAVAADAAEPVVSALRASIPSATVAEYPGEFVTLFSVRAGWDWASIFVRPVKEGAEVAVHSTFGTYAYTWGAMGGDWREFLSSCSREYAMRKLAGRAYDVSLDREEFIVVMRAEVDDFEKNTLNSWGVLDADQERQIKTCREALDDEWGWDDVPLEVLFWHFNEVAGGVPYALEMYETRMTKINPQVVGFWETIWTPFTELLASGIEARSDEPAQQAQPEARACPDAQTPPNTSTIAELMP